MRTTSLKEVQPEGKLFLDKLSFTFLEIISSQGTYKT